MGILKTSLRLCLGYLAWLEFLLEAAFFLLRFFAVDFFLLAAFFFDAAIAYSF